MYIYFSLTTLSTQHIAIAKYYLCSVIVVLVNNTIQYGLFTASTGGKGTKRLEPVKPVQPS